MNTVNDYTRYLIRIAQHHFELSDDCQRSLAPYKRLLRLPQTCRDIPRFSANVGKFTMSDDDNRIAKVSEGILKITILMYFIVCSEHFFIELRVRTRNFKLFFSRLFVKLFRLRLVPLSLSPLCVTRKKTVKKKQGPGFHAAIFYHCFLSRHAQRTKRKRDYS